MVATAAVSREEAAFRELAVTLAAQRVRSDRELDQAAVIVLAWVRDRPKAGFRVIPTVAVHLAVDLRGTSRGQRKAIPVAHKLVPTLAAE